MLWLKQCFKFVAIFFHFQNFQNCALNAFWCCTSLRVELQSTFSNRLYLPITKFIDPLCSASKIIILCVQCDFTSVFILKDDLRDTTQNWLFSGGSFILLGFRPVRLIKLSVIQNGIVMTFYRFFKFNSKCYNFL